MKNKEEEDKYENVLHISYEIIQLIEQNIMLFNDEETEAVITSNESMSFHIENNNIDRAYIEALNLKEYLIKLKKENL
tara:strand:+ start:528 stop:761 length:234 start_codon:yes stop_codon:yes gene_type:complete